MKSTKRAREISLSYISWKAVGENIKKILPTLLMAFLTGAIGIALCFLSQMLGYISIPLLTIPFIFAAAGCIASYPNGGEVSNSNFFRGFAAYFTVPYYGSYRVVWSFFKALLFGSLATMLIAAIVSTAALSSSPELVSQYQAFQEGLYADPNFDLNEFLAANGAFNALYLATAGLEFGTTAVLHVYFLLGEAPNPFIRNHAKNLSVRGLAFIKREVNSKEGYSYRKDFWKLFWPCYIAIPAFFALGCVVGYYTPTSIAYEASIMVSSGYAGIFICIILLLPYIAIGSSNLADRYKGEFQGTAVSLAQQAIKNAEMQRQRQQEALNAMKRDLEEAQRRAEEEARQYGNTDQSQDNNNDTANPSDGNPTDGTGTGDA